MTVKLYDADAYLTTFTSKVLTCEKGKSGYLVTLEETAFYPEGGGQPYDLGTLNDIAVIDVQEREDVIYHTLEEPLAIGATVTGKIDWNRRFDFMQNHSGEHILSGVICAKYDCDNVGFHMGKDRITIDFNAKIPQEDLFALEERANTAIWSDMPICISYPSKDALSKMNYRSKIEIDGQVRITEIAGYDCCACCGTHVRTAGEIGIIKIIGVQNYKGGTRMEILCGKRALQYLHEVNHAATKIGTKLSTPTQNIALAVDMLMDEKEVLVRQNSSLKQELFKRKAETISGAKNICFFSDGLNGKDMIHLADMLLSHVEERVMVLNKTQDGFAYVLLTKAEDGNEWRARLAEQFHAKGGGKPSAIQGRLEAKADVLKEYFLQFGFEIKE